MGWQDRDYNNAPNWRDEPRWKRGLRRVFEGDDFFSWSLPLFRFRGIDVRIHIFFVAYIAIELIISALSSARLGPGYVAMQFATLFTIVLIHEFGHCFACRWVGGHADRIVMWPLGGLAMCAPPRNWKASLITTLGGPAVHLVIGPALALVMLAMGAHAGILIFNPFAPSVVFGDPWFWSEGGLLRQFIWFAYLSNAAIFLFNMLLVMFPMDAGRVLQELLWARLGYKRSMHIATTVGLVLAVLIGLVAITAPPQSGMNILFGIAIFAGLTCFYERKRLAMIDDYAFAADEPWRGSAARPRKPGAPSRRLETEMEQARKEQAEVDRILEKVGREGLASLTRTERKLLKRATDRQRERESRAARR
ncbi:MAG: hypothetical protein KF768_05905 [Phycisphaeraceae bacterium]|nr:hypothetical protein [Phycisphaeraceae bacterium]